MELLADTHVHVHDCFDPDRVLDAAALNFDRAAPDQAPAHRLDILCLTDVCGQQTDLFLCETLRQSKSWRFSFPSDQSSVCAERRDGRRLHLLPGRQIISKENLELLALNCRHDVADRIWALPALIDEVWKCGGVPVVPWGFGKWTGRRGEVVRQLMETRNDFLLADNGNRLQGTPLPVLLEEGRRKGFAILAGSDPLPLKSQERRTATYGVRATLGPPETNPAQAFRQLVAAKTWTIYGQLTSPAAFLFCQVRMQIIKRIGR
jgi:hypothetical protein